ncbi:TetR/AcrR family transcriptional regulator [Goodfellowiella coeruleoviolacea]|uniref:Transcriptional regulator, TetR family n=1 Tax=Goodfellowiella coeruleoviolacea TaxID=334858 RepID=A0AAE3GEW4_9PSEU|nr:TetR/AcrR family transcriptional regulator [Goodfellowiella coeruleoviolacea]MCP2166074.1 transcriptional regulator, TetR family [Goodfellowiella coeruleoviolacea]
MGTRDRIVQVASRLLQRQGYEGTPIKQIATQAKATLGSVYHFFPGGKQEVAAAAIRHGDQEFAELLHTGLNSTDDLADALVAVTRLLAEALRESDWIDGCPVTTTALETVGQQSDIQQACAEALRHWQDLVADRFRRGGITEPDATELAGTVVNTLEGAEMAAQVTRSETPLLVAGKHLARLVSSYPGARHRHG